MPAVLDHGERKETRPITQGADQLYLFALYKLINLKLGANSPIKKLGH